MPSYQNKMCSTNDNKQILLEAKFNAHLADGALRKRTLVSGTQKSKNKKRQTSQSRRKSASRRKSRKRPTARNKRGRRSRKRSLRLLSKQRRSKND